MTQPYSALAAGYDAVMAHVDYPFWAAYLQSLLREHHPEAETLVELGCGTGQHAAFFAGQFPGLTWLPTDFEPSSVDSAAQWAEAGLIELRRGAVEIVDSASLAAAGRR